MINEYQNNPALYHEDLARLLFDDMVQLSNRGASVLDVGMIIPIVDINLDLDSPNGKPCSSSLPSHRPEPPTSQLNQRLRTLCHFSIVRCCSGLLHRT